LSQRRRFGIASDRPWNRDLARRLSGRIPADFIRISSKEQLDIGLLEEHGLDAVFLPHWSYKVPPEVYERLECIIFHMTDLPYGRGGAPLQNLILRGHTETVVCALRCVEELDAGPIYMRRTLGLGGSAEEIFLRVDRLIEEMIEEWILKRPKPVPQVGEPVPFRRRRSDDGNLEGASSLDEAFDRIRMLDAAGYPPAFLDFGPFRITLRRASRRVDGVEADARIEIREEWRDGPGPNE
jgi:methionyl-tRNA formyltransferase